MNFMIFVMVLVVGLAWLFFRWRKHRWMEKEGMPIGLRKGKVVLNEGKVSCDGDRPMHGKVDQAYRLKNGQLCLVDTKKRNINRVYQSDVIQLSVYSHCIENSKRSKKFKGFSNYGYVRLRLPKGVVYKRVNLLKGRDLFSFYDRYVSIAKGEKEPRRNNNRNMCKGCGYNYLACSSI